ncbi:synembryn-A isoform X5 [Neomonachus schauinslandi]|uniref:Synembryn n=1 Tax=Neomonachus schauinslandi TaxID=29088 RepID=A0A2Y9HEV6_NEOSC|nr:synembryn-A isoform X5 [Neomonachus schauinslandi]
MEPRVVADAVEAGEEDVIMEALRTYNRENSQSFTFDDAQQEDRKRLAELLVSVLEQGLPPSRRVTWLQSIRILSRDRSCLDPFTGRQSLQALARYAGIAFEQSAPEPLDMDVVLESLKCLCNLVLSSPVAQVLAAEARLVVRLAERVGLYHKSSFPHDIQFFDLRLLFLLTALRTDVRQQLFQELRGVHLLTNALELTLGMTPEENPPELLPPQETERAMEILKVLFNITFDSIKREVDEPHSEPPGELAPQVSGRPLCPGATQRLLGVPWSEHGCDSCPSQLPGEASAPDAQAERERGPGAERADRVCPHAPPCQEVPEVPGMGQRGWGRALVRPQPLQAQAEGRLPPQVLPPLRDVRTRPEVGELLRNKLVRLMTHLDTDVKRVAAEFLFVLCSESVPRFIKYTGYGNAAGLLAARGLMAGGRPEGQYSEDEDTDTDEYKEAKASINPVTGRVEEKPPNPMEGMTEEQKEHEAMKLVNMFDKLSRHRVIQPMGMSPRGQLTSLQDAICETMEGQLSSEPDSDPD